jgi:hypothetical protein
MMNMSDTPDKPDDNREWKKSDRKCAECGHDMEMHEAHEGARAREVNPKSIKLLFRCPQGHRAEDFLRGA